METITTAATIDNKAENDLFVIFFMRGSFSTLVRREVHQRRRRQNNPDNHGSKQSASHRNTSEMVPALKTKNRCRPETNWRCWSCQGLHERDCPARRTN